MPEKLKISSTVNPKKKPKKYEVNTHKFFTIMNDCRYFPCN